MCLKLTFLVVSNFSGHGEGVVLLTLKINNCSTSHLSCCPSPTTFISLHFAICTLDLYICPECMSFMLSRVMGRDCVPEDLHYVI